MLIRNFVAVMVFVLFMPFVVNAAQDGGPAIGKTAPNFLGRTFEDKVYRLKNDKGSPKVINFFWVECKPCREEMPELGKLEKQFKNVKFIAVHTQQEPRETVAKFVKSLAGAPSNIVLTSGGIQGTFQYVGLPHTIVLDSDNTVLLNISGYTPGNMQRLLKALQQLPK